MKFFSTQKQSPEVTFAEAVVKGLAPDNGLYFPERIEKLPETFFKNIQDLSIGEISYEVAKRFVQDEIPADILRPLVEEVMNFPLPLVEIEPGISSLELFHGPTCAFKDVGARFMARCLGYFNRNADQEVTVLVATSGDTGSAVANGFLGVEGVKVIILYPSGGVSEIQEKQLTTLGQNITALEVKGVFDDCQTLVKKAFLDPELNAHLSLTSANSINIARLVPQSFYYFYGYAQVKDPTKPVVMCVPSGNFGNITAGLFAREMGLPIHQYIAATNANNVVPEYLESGVYRPRPSAKTISNAMDVGAPSNFVRILELFNHDLDRVREAIAGTWFDDTLTRATIKEVFDRTGYTLDPHGAVGYLGTKQYLKENDATGIFLETAHPAKFLDVVEDSIGQKIEIPERLQVYLNKEKNALMMENNFDEFKSYLLKR